LFVSATLPAPFSTLMTAPRPAALLFLRSLIVALAWVGAIVSGLLGGVALGQSTPAGFSLIPGGSFTMGRTSGDTDANAPSITVTVSPFYLQQTETTKAQWDEVRTWAVNNGYTDLGAGAGKAANHPVHSVNWWDVVKWCNARSEKEGLTPVYTVGGAVMRMGTTEPVANWSADGYRLPTEAEWEKAARGGVEGKRFPWGTDTISHAQANYYGSSSYGYDQSPINNYHPIYGGGGQPNTSPVGSFEQNGYGLYDMAGNVSEWCWDWYGSNYYTTSNGTTDPRGPASGSLRTDRGGSWPSDAFYPRCAQRGHPTPSHSYTSVSFRPARTHLIENMSYIPGGSFTMGRTSGDTDADAPPVTVTVSPFYIQQTETTKAQWDEVRTWGLSNGYTDLPTGEGKAANHPVQTVNWWDVVKWCNARSEKEGLIPVYTVSGAVMRSGTTEPTANWSANGYRLPTEAEWEKAARGGVSGKRFPWGTDTISHAEANFQNDGGEAYATGTSNYHPGYSVDGFPFTSLVGSFAANGYGLYDIAGNVWEWCWDSYGSGYYTTSNGTTDPRGPASDTGRVIRGGSWGSQAIYARCAFRVGHPAGNPSLYLGFRPARNIVPIINSHPLPLTVSRDDSATFSVAATGNGTLTYQWQKDGVDIPGATSSSFSLAAAQPWHIGDYAVKVTDSVGAVTSEIATLSLNGVNGEIWKGLVGYYPMNGDMDDITINSNHGQALDLGFSPDRFGLINRSMRAIQTRGSTTVGNVPVTGSQSRTISIWFYADTQPLPSEGWLLKWGEVQNGKLQGLIYSQNFPSEGRNLRADIFYGGTAATGFPFDLSGAWHQLTAVYANQGSGDNQFTIYLDGAPCSNPTSIGESSLDTAQTPLTINWGSPAGGTGINGYLDDLRIYNRALSATEVQALYVSESSLPPTLLSPSSTQITATSATLGGNVTSDGGAWRRLLRHCNEQRSAHQWHGRDQSDRDRNHRSLHHSRH
jgi:formylglycine-generating enzyme required for sulfatase activity